MTNSIFPDNVDINMFAQKFVANLIRPFGFAQGREKARLQKVDVIAEQVRQVLQDSGQKLILMVRS